MHRSCFTIALLLSAWAGFARGGDDLSIGAGTFIAEKGVWRFAVTSPYQKGENAVEVLLPDDFNKTTKYRVLYCLPVETGIGGQFGDALR